MKLKLRILTAWLTTCLLAMLTGSVSADKAVAVLLKNPPEWFSNDEGRRITANILSWQSELGGWPKNVDTAAAPYTGSDPHKDLKPTFDNGATTDELRFLARAYAATSDIALKGAIERGVDHILHAQYPTGGWPQFYPPDKAYHHYITFNDDAMVRLMIFLREVSTDANFRFLGDTRKQSAKSAFDRGIACILKCQIKVDGKLTAWCAQHDEKDYSPREGRKFEPVSISGGESVGIVRLLMSLEKPSSEVVQSINGAVAWFDAVKIQGIRLDTVPDPKGHKGTNRVVVKDPDAKPIWARFYEIGTNKPMFVDRDSVVKYDISDIGYERRNGYSWMKYWPEDLLVKEYPAWKVKHEK